MTNETRQLLKFKLKSYTTTFKDKICEQTGFSKSYIDMWFRGERESDKIRNAAYELLRKEFNKKKEQDNLLQIT